MGSRELLIVGAIPPSQLVLSNPISAPDQGMMITTSWWAFAEAMFFFALCNGTSLLCKPILKPPCKPNIRLVNLLSPWLRRCFSQKFRFTDVFIEDNGPLAGVGILVFPCSHPVLKACWCSGIIILLQENETLQTGSQLYPHDRPGVYMDIYPTAIP